MIKSERLDSPEKCFQLRCTFSNRSGALFTGPASTLFSKKNFKTESHSIIHTFKNYFATVFSAISGIQTDPKYDVE